MSSFQYLGPMLDFHPSLMKAPIKGRIGPTIQPMSLSSCMISCPSDDYTPQPRSLAIAHRLFNDAPHHPPKEFKFKHKKTLIFFATILRSAPIPMDQESLMPADACEPWEVASLIQGIIKSSLYYLNNSYSSSSSFERTGKALTSLAS